MKEPSKRTPGRRSAKQSQATLEQILQTAEKLFSQCGYAGTSVRDLSSAMGIAGSTVLHHVGSKSQLYAMVLERIAASSSIVMQHIEDADAATVIRQFAARFMLWVELHPDYAKIVLRELMENPPRLGEVHHWHLAGFLDEAMKLTAPAAARSGHPPIAPDMLLIILLGAITYFHLAWPTFSAVRGTPSHDAKRRFMDTLDELLRASLGEPQP